MELKDVIKNSLENAFHVGFVVKEDKGSYEITLSGYYKNGFVIKVEIIDDYRLRIKCHPELYAAAFLHELNIASYEKRSVFCSYWDKLSPNCFEVSINNVKVNKDEFLNNFQTWNEFSLRYSLAPYYKTGEDKYAKICSVVKMMCSMMLSLVCFVIEGYEEGKEVIIQTTKHERNPINRQLCLYLKGTNCSVCGMSFEKSYGPIGKEFIEVHHELMVSQMEEGHVVIPEKELYPVCPNCHAMLHRKNPPFTIEELKNIIKGVKNEI